MIVMKFGGSSIDSPQAYKSVANIIESRRSRKPIVVLSASGDTTDHLTQSIDAIVNGSPGDGHQLLRNIHESHQSMAETLIQEATWRQKYSDISGDYFSELHELLTGASMLHDISNRSIDRILSFGERYSTLLMHCYLQSRHISSSLMDSRDFIRTDQDFTRARPLFGESNRLIRQYLNLSEVGDSIPIVQGFIGSTKSGDTTTLGRGGSDYSAGIIGAALEVEDIEIWSDVDGILTADPTIIHNAKVVNEMTFREAAELAYFGAKVLHPDTILPAVEKDIPIHIYNTRNQSSGGSLIRNDFPVHKNHPVVKSIAYKENISVLNLTSTRMFQAHDFLRKVFEVLDRHKMAADLVSTSEVSVSIAFHKNINYQPILDELSKFSVATVENSKAIVCLVGEQMRNFRGLPASVFQSLGDVHVNMISQGASEVNLSFVINESDIEKVIAKLHAVFFQ